MSLELSAVRKLYMDNTKLFKTTSVIASKGQDEKGTFLRLADTIFHPQGGGQPFDTGRISSRLDFNRKVEVISVQKEPSQNMATNPNDFNIKHYIDSANADLEVGEEVDLEIDPERRILNARLHSAGHLIAAVVEKNFPFLRATKGHHYPKEAYVEFQSTAPKIAPTLPEEVEKLLKNDLSEKTESNSSVEILDESGRKIKMGDFDAVPCGGTHVENLNEIGEIAIRKVGQKKQTLKISYGIGEE